MRRAGTRGRRALDGAAAALGAAGASLTLEMPGRVIRVGRAPDRTRVVFHSLESLAPLVRRDPTGLAEGYLRGEIDVRGDFREAVKITDVLAPGPSPWERLCFAMRLLCRDRRRRRREAVAAHYDRPAEFFLPWFERWRSYSHGLYRGGDDRPGEAQARKLQRAVDALGLESGMRVLDVGAGWGSFLEYAGRLGIRVHGITLSRTQQRFVETLIDRLRLPCSIQYVDFLDFAPRDRFDGAVFMGTLEHIGHSERAARFLERHLSAEGRVWADFCSAPGGSQPGAFLARHIFPDARYVDLGRLVRALARSGFSVWELADDTRSYAYTCRDWADALEGQHEALAEAFGERTVRTFQVYLRASERFFETGRTRAHHLVAGRGPAPPGWRVPANSL